MLKQTYKPIIVTTEYTKVFNSDGEIINKKILWVRVHYIINDIGFSKYIELGRVWYEDN